MRAIVEDAEEVEEVVYVLLDEIFEGGMRPSLSC
jgi:hypothetical protein